MPGKLLLVHPSNRLRRGFANHESTSFMPLGLGIVAALTMLICLFFCGSPRI
jgi:hypothetical protein